MSHSISTRTADADAARAREEAALPRLAVLIPVYNNSSGCQRALESLARDTQRFDVIVVDDGSEPPLEVQQRLPFRVRLLRLEPNRGIAAALNAGLDEVYERGYQYVARLDADDQSLPGRFDAQLAFLDDHPDHAAVGTQANLIRPDGSIVRRTQRPLTDRAIRRFMRYKNPIVHPGVMVRASAIREAGGYRSMFPSSEDFDLWYRLAKRYKLANLSVVGIHKELGPRRITANRRAAARSRLKLLGYHMKATSPHAYLGLARAAMAFLAFAALPRKKTFVS